MSKWNLTASLLKNRLNLFYVLAFAPILPIQYFGYVARRDLFAALIPMYGFLLLLIKKDKLSSFAESRQIPRLIGSILMLTSFFIYYAVALFYPQAQLYGATNYTVYLIGLFLAFYQISALKESFTTLFLIVATASTWYIGEWMELYLEPFVPFFAQIIGSILLILGIPFTFDNPNIFILRTLNGEIQPLSVVPRCIGIYSFLTFAIIIVVTMMEDPSNLRTKLLWSVAGIIGTFVINIIRVSFIFVGIYFYGFEIWSGIHSVIGYILFILWLAIFFLIFSKRQATLNKFQAFRRKLQ